MGCGACAHACAENMVRLGNVGDSGIRPTIAAGNCGDCTDCLQVCPGISMGHDMARTGKEPSLRASWGPVLEVWEGYAADRNIRFMGSSGGAATAIALYCLEKEGMAGVLHTGSDDVSPTMNKTAFSTTRDQVLLTTGSRYSPASPCDGLSLLEKVKKPGVFIGKPCDVQALRKAQKLRPNLDSKVGVAIGIFCAGTPATKGLVDLLATGGVKPEQVEEIRFRGMGWPGNFTVRVGGKKDPALEMPYMKAWGFLQKYRPYRCYLCPDGTSEFADLSCGDPWYREIQEGEPGHSLILARTERGREILRGAMAAGYIEAKGVEPRILELSQKNLLDKRRSIWGRLLAMKMFGIPTPQYEGFYLYEGWRQLSLKEKARSVLGTIRRIVQRKYYRPLSEPRGKGVERGGVSP